MKKLIAIFLFIILVLPSSTFAKGCIDNCTAAYDSNVSQTLGAYESELASQVWNTFESVASSWTSKFGTPGPMEGSNSSYWNTLAIIQIYEDLLEWNLETFNSCVNGCS